MKKIYAAFASGLLFSMGLLISGMAQPRNIIGFLDVFGEWRPALLWVMVGAVSVYAIGHRLVLKRSSPLFAAGFQLPSNKKINSKLLVGAAAFGVGWGLGGICPGPALVTLGSAAPEAFIFFVAMLAGMVLYRLSSQSDLFGSDDDVCG